MGAKSRLHKQAVIQGKEPAFRQAFRDCLLCGDTLPEFKAREHIRKCWQYPIGDAEPIPAEPIVYRNGLKMEHWKAFRKKKVAK
jgi:hypothetical protein